MSAPRFRAWRFLHPDLDVGEERAGLRVAATGALEMVEQHAAVRQAVLLLLSTMPGERVMRPEYGCELHRLAFSPNDDTTAGLAIHYVRRALERWEPRIQLLQVDAGRSLRVEDGEGSYLELTPSGVRLHSKAPLDIEAPGQPVVIRGQSIDFRRG